VGGASVFLWREADPKRIDVLNDIDKHIVAMYMAMKLYPKAFIRLLDSRPYSRALFNEGLPPIAAPLTALNREELLHIAVATYYKLCSSFANSLVSKGFNIDLKGVQYFPRSWQNKIRNLKLIVSRFSTAYIECADMLDTIQRYDSPNTLFYIDTPYVGSYQDYPSAGFTAEMLVKLLTTLTTIEGSFLLSSYKLDQPPSNATAVYYRELTNNVDRQKAPTEYLYVGANQELENALTQFPGWLREPPSVWF
jgi:DNA adenine methylase